MSENLSICSIFIWVDCLQMQGTYISLFKVVFGRKQVNTDDHTLAKAVINYAYSNMC